MRILVIPDTQVKPGQNFEYLEQIGKYIVEKTPDVVVHLGDHWDMPSLSSYDFGKKVYEGRRYLADIEAGNEAMDTLLRPLRQYNFKQKLNAKKQYTPRLVFITGNHEQRIERAVNNDAKLEGIIGYKDLNLKGWEVYPFLEVVIIEGIAFSHYFVTGIAGRPAATANAQLSKKHMSCIAGHQPGRQVATAHRADGKRLTSIIAGSCYNHMEDYQGPQGNNYWRGVIMLNEVNDGQFDEMPISLDYLERRYA